MSYASWHTMRSFSRDRSVAHQRLTPGTVRRIFSYARPYRTDLILFLVIVALDAVVTVAVPLMLRGLIDDGILPRKTGVVLAIGSAVAGLALLATDASAARATKALLRQAPGHTLEQQAAAERRAQRELLRSRLGG